MTRIDHGVLGTNRDDSITALNQVDPENQIQKGEVKTNNLSKANGRNVTVDTQYAALSNNEKSGKTLEDINKTPLSGGLVDININKASPERGFGQVDILAEAEQLPDEDA